MTVGINLGAGSRWRHDNWLGLDEACGEKLTENTTFSFEDKSISYVYSSHFFEHITDSVAENLIEETYRVLKPSGVLRLVVPDFREFFKRYKSNDVEWYSKIGFTGRPDWPPPMRGDLTYIMLHFMSNFDIYDRPPHNGGRLTYRGPPQVDKEEVREKSISLDFAQFYDWLQSLIPKHLDVVKTQHINFWDMDKIDLICKKSWF